MLPVRPRARVPVVRNRGSGEVERVAPGVDHHLDHRGARVLPRVDLWKRRRRHQDVRLGEQGRGHRVDHRRVHQRLVPLQVDQDLLVHPAGGLGDTVGAGGAFGGGENRLAPEPAHHRSDPLVVRGDHDARRDFRGVRLAPDIPYHRAAVDFGQRLPRQPRRAVAGGDHHRHASARPGRAHGNRGIVRSPSSSGNPCIRLKHCTAAPAAPFTRLSMAETTTTRRLFSSTRQAMSQ